MDEISESVLSLKVRALLVYAIKHRSPKSSGEAGGMEMGVRALRGAAQWLGAVLNKQVSC